MNQFSYRPGSWQLVVESGGVVAVPADVEAARLETLHRMLRDGTPALTDVIDVLAAGSIAALGSFAVALTSGDSIRFAVRGPVQARIIAAGDDEVVSGAEVSTWTERYIADAEGFELSVDDPQADSWYPIVSGVVLGAALRHGTTDATPAEAAEQDAESESAAAAVASASVALDPSDGAESAAAEPSEEEPAITEAAVFQDPVSGTEPGVEQREEQSEPEPQSDAEGDSSLQPEAEAGGASLPGDEPSIAHTLIPADLTLAPMSEAEPAPAAPAVPVASAAGIPSDIPGLGDHDGATISAAELRRQRSQSGITTEPPTSGPDAPTAVLPVVDASSTHGVARLSTGQVIELDRTVIIGRRPRSTRVSGDSMPHLVAVESPQQDISRSHLEIRPEGDSVVVIDLRTTNGSTLLRPGADPVRLHPGEHTLVLSGDVVDLGDGVTVAFEGLV